MSSEEGYCLVRRESTLGKDVWYVIPAERRQEWEEWVEKARGQDPEPEWADLLDGVGMLETLRFERYWILE